jgi:two-component system, chemotaxis family, sensor kinase CheA
MSLPLTLAVLDGMVVSVGEQTLVVPITVIVETLQPKAADIRLLGPGGAVVSVRGAYVPLIDVGVALGWPTSASTDAGVTILVESGPGEMAALRVDAIQGQRQVVIKSLEQNYDQVDDIAAATILGDGRVALILDVDALISRRRRGSAASAAPAGQTFLQAS